jgi:diguanylate cyclase (GGDEF)-like protein
MLPREEHEPMSQSLADHLEAVSSSPADQGRLAMAALRVRLLTALLGSAIIGIGVSLAVDRLAAAPTLLVAVAGLAGMIASCALLADLAVAPVARVNEELQARYRSALADALSDPLTKLGNHRAFQEELDRQVEQALRYDTPLALVLIDLDDFRQVNEVGGHAGGDRALARMGRLLESSIRRPDRAFRIGGDELALLLPHAEADGARTVVRRILAASLQPGSAADGLADGLSFSAGVSAVPALAVTRSELYAQADAALYAAKRGGRTTVEVFEPLLAPAVPLGDASAAVAQLIAHQQMLGVYQPIVELASGAVLGYEGLTRPQPPSPFENPAQLFEAAEASGRSLALDRACLEMLVRGARGLDDRQVLSVNLSPVSIEAAEFGPGTILAILGRHGFAPQRLVIELTEREQIGDMGRVRDRLEACRRTGMRLAVDDLGAGNAGLRLLSELRFDILKVDLAMVQRSTGAGMSGAVLGSVVSLAASTGALVIAEGIEEERHLAQIRELGVSAGQGYLLGRPDALPASPAAVAPPVDEAVDIASPMALWRQSIGLHGPVLLPRG